MRCLLFCLFASALLAVLGEPTQATRWNRLNAIRIANGTHIVREGTDLYFHEQEGNGTRTTLRTVTPRSGHNVRDSGWISSTWTWSPVTSFSALWTVPPAPTNNNGQILFYFNSFESSTGNDILQPVLQFNNIIGGWSLASWYGDSGGNYYHTDAVQVNTGDVILGVISQSNNAWNILGYVNNVLKTTISVSFNTIGAQANAQFAMEVYSISSCDMYPPTNAITVTNIVIQNGNSNVVPSWTTSINSNTCSAGANAVSNANGVQLTWRSGSTTPNYTPYSIGIDYNGGDLVLGKAASGMECAQQCDNTQGCVAWTYAYPGSGCASVDANRCWLKSSVGTRSANSCRESSVKLGVAGVDHSGGDMAGMPLSLGQAATAATCAATCDATTGCTSWAFNTPSCGGSSCWLKNAHTTTYSAGCRVSGVRGTVGQDRSGNDIAGSPIVLPSSASATQCADRCASTAGCVAWAFVYPGSGCGTANNCWLKNAVGTPTANSCRISGVL